MRNQKSFWTFVILVTIVAVGILRARSVTPQVSVNEAPGAEATTTTPNVVTTAEPAKKTESAAAATQAKDVALPSLTPNTPSKSTSTPQALKSLTSMTTLLSEFAQGSRPIKELVGRLKAQKERPFVARTVNSETGEVAIVRTDSPLPGTRYFHAQYEGSGEKQFVEHMSFEFAPSPTAMRDAIAAVQTEFKPQGRPGHLSRDFVQWDLPDGRVVWIKRLSKNDLADSPYDAHRKTDVGVIQVAVELNQEELAD